MSDMQVPAEAARVNDQVVVLAQPAGVQQSRQIVRVADLAPAVSSVPTAVAHVFSD
jgi:hypothetical protein